MYGLRERITTSQTNINEQKILKLHELHMLLLDYRMAKASIFFDAEPFWKRLQEFLRESQIELTLEHLFKEEPNNHFDIGDLSPVKMKALFEIYHGLETAIDFSKFTFKKMFYTIHDKMRDSSVSDKTLNAVVVYIKEQQEWWQLHIPQTGFGYGSFDPGRQCSPVTTDEDSDSEHDADLISFDEIKTELVSLKQNPSDDTDSTADLISFDDMHQSIQDSQNSPISGHTNDADLGSSEISNKVKEIENPAAKLRSLYNHTEFEKSVIPTNIWPLSPGLEQLIKFGYTLFRMDPNEIDPNHQPSIGGYDVIL